MEKIKKDIKIDDYCLIKLALKENLSIIDLVSTRNHVYDGITIERIILTKNLEDRFNIEIKDEEQEELITFDNLIDNIKTKVKHTIEINNFIEKEIDNIWKS